MQILMVVGLALLALVTGAIGSGTNDIAKVCAFFFFISALALYFSPTISAAWRKHKSVGAIFALNLLAGWTFVGWLVALVWSLTKPDEIVVVTPPVSESGATAATPDANDQRDCPFCAEPIKLLARKCKHCGSEVEPLTA